MGIKTTSTFVGNTRSTLNAIRNSSSAYYQENVPILQSKKIRDLNEIGDIIINDARLQNEFISTLINRIGLVIMRSKMFTNPWSVFKYGELELGEVVEEIFVELAKPFEYDPETAEKQIFKREIPDVQVAYHKINYSKFYKQTVQNESLKKAFITWSGLEDLIAQITNSMYNAMNYDEFLAMKYLLARDILNGNIKIITVPEITDDATANNVVAKIRGISNAFTFMSNEYNRAGVRTYSDRESQYLISSSDFDATVSVDVLARAFNMDNVKFMGHQILVDSLGNLDIERLNMLFANTPDYVEPSLDELNELNKISSILVDKSFFMIIDAMLKFTENYNGEGLYWNYWLHVWKILSTSPFANAVAFVTGTPAVTAISVTPVEISLPVGATSKLTVNVSTEYFAPKAVTFSSNSENVTVDKNGNITVLSTATTGDTAKITVTSTFDNTKTAETTVIVT